MGTLGDSRTVGMAFFGYKATGEVVDPTARGRFRLTERATAALRILERDGRIERRDHGYKVLRPFDDCVAWCKQHMAACDWQMRVRV